MSLWRIVLTSLRQHRLSTALAVVTIALGVSLTIAVVSLREQANASLSDAGTGVDAILGPKGSPLQIVLNGLFHLEEMPGTVPWSSYEQVLAHPIVEQAIPFRTGHSYAGFRVNAIDPRFLTDFAYLPGRKFSVLPRDGGQGRFFLGQDEAVAGWAAAKELGIAPGGTFSPVCGVSAGPEHRDTLTFVGVLAPTGTPHDRAIYVPLERFLSLEGHEEAAGRAAAGEQEISGAYLKIRRVRGGALNLNLQAMKYDVNRSPAAQLVIPSEVLPRLLGIIGWVDGAFLAVAALVTALGALCLLAALVSALRERRRDIAMLRFIGATRRTVLGLVLSESLVISLLGGLAGFALGHALVWVVSQYLRAETGLRFSWLHLSPADAWLLPALILVGGLAGLFPAVQAYRLGVLTNLRPLS